VPRVKSFAEKEPDIEYTLAIIKPEAVIYRKEIERRIHTEGFQICHMRWLQLTPEQVSEFYNDRFGELSFPHLVVYMSSGPVVVFVLAKKDAVVEWKRIIGPTTVLGTESSPNSDLRSLSSPFSTSLTDLRS